MRVIKRLGGVEGFDSAKIKTSIANTSDSINKPLNQGDLNTITNAVSQKIRSRFKDEITYIQIRDIVVEELRDGAFFDIAKAYKEPESLKKFIENI